MLSLSFGEWLRAEQPFRPAPLPQVVETLPTADTAKPVDSRARAKAHTELGMVYYQGAQMGVALFSSLRPLLNGEQKITTYDSVYGAYLELQRPITHEGWKLIAYPKAKVLRLYHLAEDPQEMTDLAAKPAHVARKKEMLERLVKLSSELGDQVDLKASFGE